LPEVESAEESVLPDPQAAMEKARTAAREPAASLRREIMEINIFLMPCS